MAKLNAIRKKQIMLILGGLMLILGLSVLGGYLAQGNKPVSTRVEKPVTVSTVTPGSTINSKDVWMASEAAKISANAKKSEDILRDLEAIKNGTMPIGQKDGKDNLPPAPPPPLASPMPNFPPPALPPQVAATGSLQERTNNQANLHNKQNAAIRPGMIAPNGQPYPVDANGQLIQQNVDEGIFALEINNAEPVTKSANKSASTTAEHDAEEGALDANNVREVDDMTIGQYLPSGTFTRVVMLSGLDAPTGGQAQTNPHPVLFKVEDPAQLPNKYKADLRECIITGNGYGDLSSERAYIRTDRISCIDEDGKTIDMPFKGYIAGEDGKAGMRGRLISKQGRILANALLAGIGSGLGQAFRESATTQTAGFGGTTSTVNGGQEFQAGISAGVGKAMDQLAKYYISLAEKVYPVIEVDGGRIADVVITRGFNMERK